MTNIDELKRIIEAALFASGEPLTIDQLQKIIGETAPSTKEMRELLQLIMQDYQGRVLELREVASGFRFQVRQDYSSWVGKLWEEKPPRYSRALLETLALVAYNQPITRAEIEEIRGVAVSSNIVKTLIDRDWIKIVGHRDVPGKPALFATTKQFLDDMNLRNLEQLPPLEEIKALEDAEDELAKQLSLEIQNQDSHAVMAMPITETKETIEELVIV